MKILFVLHTWPNIYSLFSLQFCQLHACIYIINSHLVDFIIYRRKVRHHDSLNYNITALLPERIALGGHSVYGVYWVCVSKSSSREPLYKIKLVVPMTLFFMKASSRAPHFWLAGGTYTYHFMGVPPPLPRESSPKKLILILSFRPVRINNLWSLRKCWS